MLRSALVITAVGVGLAWFLARAPLDQGLLTTAYKAFGGATPQVAAGSQHRQTASAIARSPAASLGPDSFAIDADRGGQFETTMLIRGRELPALVDTGATYVLLSFDSAASIGVHPSDAEFRYTARTANGIARAAAVVLPAIRVGNVEAHDVQAFVSQPGALTGSNLLGMSFLRRLSGFEFEAGRLVLRQ